MINFILLKRKLKGGTCISHFFKICTCCHGGSRGKAQYSKFFYQYKKLICLIALKLKSHVSQPSSSIITQSWQCCGWIGIGIKILRCWCSNPIRANFLLLIYPSPYEAIQSWQHCQLCIITEEFERKLIRNFKFYLKAHLLFFWWCSTIAYTSIMFVVKLSSVKKYVKCHSTKESTDKRLTRKPVGFMQSCCKLCVVKKKWVIRYFLCIFISLLCLVMQF